jgi:phosphotransferase system HPr-like phosphotransfer protein
MSQTSPSPPAQLPEEEPQIINIPPEQTQIITEPAPEPRRNGCLWGVTGALGCLAILMLPFALAIVMGMTTLNTVIGSVQSIFNPQQPVVITATVMLERIQALSQLTTVRYNYSSLITTERDMPPLLAALYGEKQIMVAVGHINAGIDLSQITPDNIVRDGRTLTITLPPPALQDCFLNEQTSYIVSRDTGIFARPASNLDTEARRYAIQQFRDMALENGILNDVQIQAQEVIQGLLSAIGEDNTIKIVNTPPDPNAPLPETCAPPEPGG